MKPILENVSKEHVLRVFSFTKDYFEFHWHYHPEYEITWIQKGSGRRMIGHDAADFDAMDLVFLGATIPHTWISEPQAGDMVKALVIQFSEVALEPIRKLTEFSSLNQWISQSGFGWQIKGDAAVFKTMEDMETASPARQMILLYDLLWQLSQLKSRKILPNTYLADESRTGQRIAFVLHYLHHNYQHSCTLEEVSTLVRLSKSGFSNFFKKETQACYSHYLAQLRINKAKRLLIETDQTIQEIYMAVGFENQAYFNRMFKKLTLISPRVYRKKHWEHVDLGANQ